MRIPEKLKLNRFKLVRIPDNSVYFGRAGLVSSSPDLYSGEDAVIPTMRQKLDAIADEFTQWREYLDNHPEKDDNSSQ